MINSIGISSGMFYYSVPLSFLGYALEAYRFSRHFRRKTMKKIGILQNELSKNAKSAFHCPGVCVFKAHV